MSLQIPLVPPHMAKQQDEYFPTSNEEVLVIYNPIRGCREPRKEAKAPDMKWIMDQSIVRYRAWFYGASSSTTQLSQRTINSRISASHAIDLLENKIMRKFIRQRIRRKNKWLTGFLFYPGPWITSLLAFFLLFLAGSEWWRSAVGRPWVVVVRVCRPEKKLLFKRINERTWTY